MVGAVAAAVRRALTLRENGVDVEETSTGTEEGVEGKVKMPREIVEERVSWGVEYWGADELSSRE